MKGPGSVECLNVSILTPKRPEVFYRYLLQTAWKSPSTSPSLSPPVASMVKEDRTRISFNPSKNTWNVPRKNPPLTFDAEAAVLLCLHYEKGSTSNVYHNLYKYLLKFLDIHNLHCIYSNQSLDRCHWTLKLLPALEDPGRSQLLLLTVLHVNVSWIF